MNNWKEENLIRLIRIAGLVLLLGMVAAVVFGGMEIAAYVYVWFFIGVQVLTVLNGVAVFWREYSCTLTNKVVFAAFAVISAAIYVKIGFYLLDLLNAEAFDASAIFIATTIVGLIDTVLSLAAKRLLLKVPIPSLNPSRSDENDGFQA